MIAGRTIGKYRILEQIGRGGMGTVYKAVDETLDRLVAIKVINADNLSAERMQRFRSEAVALARLNHAHIASIHELTREEHDLMMVMEYVPGDTLERLIAQKGPMGVAQAVALCDQVLDALDHAHRAGIVHRDLKPANLMVTPTGEVKVMDFGIARITGSEHLTTDGYLMGTPAYMSPEQVRGSELDARVDLYAVAVVFYRLLTQNLPFRADTPMALIQAHLMDQPTPSRLHRPDLPLWIDDVLRRGLAKAPEDRFQTATMFRLALHEGLQGMPLEDLTLDRANAETYAVMTPSALRAPASHQTPVPPASSPFPVPPSGHIAAEPAAEEAAAVLAPALAAPAAPRAAAPPKESTVTLRKEHLALGGAVLAVLLIGVAVLGYVAFRRSASARLASTEVSAPESAVPAAPEAPSVETGRAATPAAGETPGTPAPPEPPAPAAPSPAPAVAVSSAPRPPTPSPPPTAGRGASEPSRASGAPRAAVETASTGTTTASAGAGSARKSGVPAKPGDAPPPPTGAAGPAVAAAPAGAAGGASAAAAAVATESFGDLKVVLPLPNEPSKSRVVDALLSLEPGKLIVRSRDSGQVLRTLTYRDIAASTYTQSKRPKGSSTPSVAPVPENLVASGFLFGTSKHWLTLQSASEFLVLRLEDKNVMPIMMSLESHAGIKTQRTE